MTKSGENTLFAQLEISFRQRFLIFRKTLKTSKHNILLDIRKAFQHVHLIIPIPSKTMVTIPNSYSEWGICIFLIQIEIFGKTIAVIRKQNKQMPIYNILYINPLINLISKLFVSGLQQEFTEIIHYGR